MEDKLGGLHDINVGWDRLYVEEQLSELKPPYYVVARSYEVGRDFLAKLGLCEDAFIYIASIKQMKAQELEGRTILVLGPNFPQSYDLQTALKEFGIKQIIRVEES